MSSVYPDDSEDVPRLTIDQYFELFEKMDGSKIEYYANHMRIAGRPFHNFVVDYLAMLGMEPRPIESDVTPN
jgi:hypothetical protein